MPPENFGGLKKKNRLRRKGLENDPMQQPQGHIPPQAPRPVTFYINLFDGITMQKANAVMSMCADILGRHPTEALYFMISSPGGEVMAGITLYNYLKALPVKIIMHNTGSIDSIANVVFLAGDERYAAPGTSFHIHGITVGVGPGQAMNAATISELQSHLSQDENKVAALIAENCTLTEQEIRELFVRGESKNVGFAVEKGIIKEVRELRIPSGVPLVSLNLANVP
jgi:ATP-dependent protease ClpP protease subunit